MALTVRIFGGHVALAFLGLLLAPQTFHAFGLVAGWALAVMLWWGWRAVPGLVLGGFWLGLFEALQFGSAGWPKAVLWASAVALLGVAQAALGYGLLRRHGQTRRLLQSSGSMRRLISHGALLPSLLGSSGGQWAWQALEGGVFDVRSWFDGYLVMVLGVLLFAPLSLCWLGRRVPGMRGRGRQLAVPLLAVFSIVALLNLGLARWERQAQDHRLDTIAGKLAMGIQHRLSARAEMLQLVANLSAAHPASSPVEFEHLVRHLITQPPDLLGLGFSDREASLRDIVPLAGNQAMMGVDPRSEPLRREAVERALGLGGMSATAPLRLVRGRVTHASVLALLPVRTVAAGQPDAGATGFVVGAFGEGPLVEAARRDTPVEGLMLELSDARVKGGAGLLYRDPVPGALVERSWSSHLHFGDRDWVFRVTPTAAFLQRDWLVRGFAGLFGVLAVGAVLIAMTKIGDRDALLARRNLELEQAGWHYRHLLEESPPPMAEPAGSGQPGATDADTRLGILSRDISQLARRHEASRQELANMKYALDQHVIVSCSDLDGRITYVNRLFCEMSGYDEADLIGQSHKLINSGLHSPESWADMWKAIHLGRVWHGEICNRHKSGSLYWVDAVIVPVFDSNGLLQQYIAICTDITRSKQIKSDLQLARAQAERANQAKSEFLAHISHEIRTPLNAMLGLVQVLGRTPLEPEQLDVLHRIQAAGLVLRRHLNDVLDFSKIEAGQMVMESRPFRLDRVLDEISGLQKSVAMAGGLTFELQAPALDHALVGDAVRLSQILLNLIGNAIKFTPRGWVRLSVFELERGARHSRLRFEVADTGIGIDADKLKGLFLPFQQADSSITRHFGGTGLGLSICKLLVELMGGRIGADSVEGQGSTFWFELPFECRELESVPTTPAIAAGVVPESGLPSLLDRRVLLVDDDEMNRDMAQRMLRQDGALVTQAVNGLQAVRLLEQQSEAFDLVLMDNQMPVLDGLQATREIRSRLGLVELPIVICSAGARAEDREQAMVAGASDFLSKPIEREQLLVVLARALADRRAPEVVEAVEEAVEVAAPAVATGPALPADWPEIEGIDSARLVVQLDGDSEYFRQILALLQRDLAQLLELLPAELAQGQFDVVGARLHKLRGAAGLVCAQPLVDACRQLEEALEADGASPREQAREAWIECAGQLLSRIRAV